MPLLYIRIDSDNSFKQSEKSFHSILDSGSKTHKQHEHRSLQLMLHLASTTRDRTLQLMRHSPRPRRHNSLLNQRENTCYPYLRIRSEEPFKNLSKFFQYIVFTFLKGLPDLIRIKRRAPATSGVGGFRKRKSRQRVQTNCKTSKL